METSVCFQFIVSAAPYCRLFIIPFLSQNFTFDLVFSFWCAAVLLAPGVQCTSYGIWMLYEHRAYQTLSIFFDAKFLRNLTCTIYIYIYVYLNRHQASDIKHQTSAFAMCALNLFSVLVCARCKYWWIFFAFIINPAIYIWCGCCTNTHPYAGALTLFYWAWFLFVFGNWDCCQWCLPFAFICVQFFVCLFVFVLHHNYSFYYSCGFCHLS